MLCHVFWSQVEYKIVCFIYLVTRVKEPLARSKMAITLKLKLCLSNFSREIERQKEVIKVQILL